MQACYRFCRISGKLSDFVTDIFVLNTGDGMNICDRRSVVKIHEFFFFKYFVEKEGPTDYL